MTCYHPRTAVKTGVKANGRAAIDFKAPLKDGYELLQLPCGQCIGCRLERANHWAARCMHEASQHQDNQFITLTYDREHVPPNGGLRPKDFTDFMKRYRFHAGVPIRYFHAGEYGEGMLKGELGRPHHHALIFGHGFTDLELFSEIDGMRTYTSPTLERLWGQGFCNIGPVTKETAAYVARYTTKKVNVSDVSPEKYRRHYQKVNLVTGEVDQVLPEYATMSRRPGIGKAWWDRYKGDIAKIDRVMVEYSKVKVPRYYDELLRATDEAQYEEVKRRRKAMALARPDGPQLAAREKVKKAAISNLKRLLK